MLRSIVFYIIKKLVNLEAFEKIEFFKFLLMQNNKLCVLKISDK